MKLKELDASRPTLKGLRKSIRKVFKKERIYKAIIIFSTLALLATSILPYLL